MAHTDRTFTKGNTRYSTKRATLLASHEGKMVSQYLFHARDGAFYVLKERTGKPDYHSIEMMDLAGAHSMYKKMQQHHQDFPEQDDAGEPLWKEA